MFKIISIMFVGLGAGYLLRDLKLMRKTEKTIPLTVFRISKQPKITRNIQA